MKKIILLYAVIVFIGCGENRNDTMTRLVNEKKVITDSIAIVNGMEGIFEDSSKSALYAGKDSVFYTSLADSSVKYFGFGHNMKERLEAVDFSIDSLSKMK